MLNLRKNQAAFTLIELLVVVIIVAVLAAVGVPLLSANVERAKASEAEAGLGSIRTGWRAYFAEHQSYQVTGGGVPPFKDVGLNTTAAATGGDLDGRYFADNAYSLISASDTAFCAQVDGTIPTNNAVKGDEVSTPKLTTSVLRSINENGKICKTACPCTGA